MKSEEELTIDTHTNTGGSWRHYVVKEGYFKKVVYLMIAFIWHLGKRQNYSDDVKSVIARS